MTGKRISFLAASAILVLAIAAGCKITQPKVSTELNLAGIVCPHNTTLLEQLAAKEVRRYVYLRTGKVPPIVESDETLPSRAQLIVIGQKDRPIVKTLAANDKTFARNLAQLEPQQYLIKTVLWKKRKVVLIAGGDSAGTLYAAYRFAEHLGIRFYLHGDTIPDKQVALELPCLDERGQPLFCLRGIQPFHDFPEGPDWWNTDDYKAIIAQLPKLGMNFIGLHAYPQGGAGPEPSVWIGLPQDIEPDGKVKFSSPSSYQNTLRGNWGYSAKKTGEFVFGTDQLFERDDYGPEVMFGKMPWPTTPEQRNEVFNDTGDMLKEAFECAHALGVKTCMGTETPLIMPDVVKERIKAMGKDPSHPAVVQEVYEGMFQRIAKAYPLDYYWFWTPEGWTWGDPKDREIQATLSDFQAAIAAAQKVKAPFTLATCGWVLGPPKDRALFDNVLPKEMPMSCINRNVGFAPVEQGFARISGRPKWAIPWLEDDPALIIPQLWVGRMRRDAADALAYGCTGLMGIHWRTRILGPNVSALARAAWNQTNWNPDLGKEFKLCDLRAFEGREGGNVAHFPNNAIADTNDEPIYQTVVWDVRAYHLKAPNGVCKVTLKFCEPHYNEAGKRVFSVRLQGQLVIDKLDIFASVGKNKALDFTFQDVKVTDGFLHIDFDRVIEFPCIAAIVVEGADVTRKINCGGPACQDYQADLSATDSDGRPRDLPADDFYADWAVAQFGPEVAEPIAKIFVCLDGQPPLTPTGQQTANLPRPSTWVDGPGGIQPDERPWDQVSKDYRFVDEFAKLRPQVKGYGNLEPFDYWLNNFRYLRAIGKVNCTWARFNAAMKQIKDEKDPAVQKRLAREVALPIRKELVAQVAEVHRHLLATVSTNGEMGTIANWQQHLLPSLLTEPGQELAKFLGENLPADAIPTKQYDGSPRLIVPTLRSHLTAGENLSLKVILLAQNKSTDAALYWRPIGKGEFKKIALTHTARSVYSVSIPAEQIKQRDIEYYIRVTTADNQLITFPASAPQINQTVIVTNGIELV